MINHGGYVKTLINMDSPKVGVGEGSERRDRPALALFFTFYSDIDFLYFTRYKNETITVYIIK